jgi:hypothetical protein
MCAIARMTLSGAPSIKSERLTKILPFRRRIVVFNEVNRRKLIAKGGMGARGRSARYSSSKIAVRSEATKFEISILETGKSDE